MSVQVENLEKNMAKLTIEVAAEKVEDAIQAAIYEREKERSAFQVSVKVKCRER